MKGGNDQKFFDSILQRLHDNDNTLTEIIIENNIFTNFQIRNKNDNIDEKYSESLHKLNNNNYNKYLLEHKFIPIRLNEFVKELKDNTTITHLVMTNCVNNNNKSIRILCNGLSEILSVNKSIKTLNISNNHIDDDNFMKIGKLFIDSFFNKQKNTTLENLDISGNNITIKCLADVLKNNKTIKSIFTHTDINDNNVKDLCKILKFNNTLTKITFENIRKFSLSNENIILLTQALNNNKTLSDFNIKFLGNSDFKNLKDVIKSMQITNIK